MTNAPWLDRITRALDASSVLETLAAGLSPTDLQSLLLHVFARRSARRREADLLAQYERSAMLRPASIDARELHALEQAAYDSAPQFEAVEWAPVAPLGVNVVLGQIHQNNCLAARKYSRTQRRVPRSSARAVGVPVSARTSGCARGRDCCACNHSRYRSSRRLSGCSRG